MKINKKKLYKKKKKKRKRKQRRASTLYGSVLRQRFMTAEVVKMMNYRRVA